MVQDAFAEGNAPYRLSVMRPSLGVFETGVERYLADDDLIGRFQPAQRRLLLDHIEIAIQTPWAVLYDLQRDGFADAICYSYSIGHVSDQFGNLLPGQANEVFLAFAYYNEDLKAMVVFDYEERVEDPWRKGLPRNYRNDFGEPLWCRYPP